MCSIYHIYSLLNPLLFLNWESFTKWTGVSLIPSFPLTLLSLTHSSNYYLLLCKYLLILCSNLQCASFYLFNAHNNMNGGFSYRLYRIMTTSCVTKTRIDFNARVDYETEFVLPPRTVISSLSIDISIDRG